MKYYKKITSYKRLRIFILALISICIFGCTETALQSEIENIDDPEPFQIVDSLLIGSWRQLNFPSAISIDRTGSVTYYSQNQVSGKFERNGAFVDKIRAVNGFFEFVETNACAPANDSTYSFEEGYLKIPIKKSYQSSDVFYSPVEIETYIGDIRPEDNYIIADVVIDFNEERNKEGLEDISYQFDAADNFELIELFSYPNPGSFITAYDNPDFDCNHPMVFHHKISLITEGPIESIGVFNLSSASVQFAGRDLEFGNTYNLGYDNSSARFEEGTLNVTSYIADENSKQIEGTFEYYLTSEFIGRNDTITVNNGQFRIIESLKP